MIMTRKKWRVVRIHLRKERKLTEADGSAAPEKVKKHRRRRCKKARMSDYYEDPAQFREYAENVVKEVLRELGEEEE